MSGPWPQLGVGAVVYHQQAVLLVQRGVPPGKGLWAVPGGRVQPGERLHAACEREIREETGITIRVGDLAWQFEYIEHHDDGTLRFHYVVLDFFANYLHGEPLAGDDANAARWVKLTELDTLSLHPETRRLLQTLYPMEMAGNVDSEGARG